MDANAAAEFFRLAQVREKKEKEQADECELAQKEGMVGSGRQAADADLSRARLDFKAFQRGWSPLQRLKAKASRLKTGITGTQSNAADFLSKNSVHYHMEDTAIIMEGGTVGFAGTPDTCLKFPHPDDAGEPDLEVDAEDLGIVACDDEQLPESSLGTVLLIHADPHLDMYLVDFEKAEKGRVQVWVSGSDLRVMPDMGRQFLVELLAEWTARHDAFVTLPQTAILTMIFICLVSGHLRIWDRKGSELGLKKWINGNIKPDCEELECASSFENNVDDAQDFFSYLEEGGLAKIFGENKTSNYYPMHEQYIAASRHVLIGDVMVQYTKIDGSEKREWLLHYPNATNHLEANPGEYAPAALQALVDLRKNQGWAKQDIESLRIEFLTFDEITGFYAKTGVVSTFRFDGSVLYRTYANICPIVPFPTYDLYFWDALYFLLVLRVAFKEGRDALSALRLGLGEFIDYFEFWNCVDWMSIFFASAFGGLWATLMFIMKSDVLHSILEAKSDKSAYQIKTDVMTKLTVANLDELSAGVDQLTLFFKLLFIVAGLNSFAIVSQFFKGFTSNARLELVVVTFEYAAQDLAHFAIVLSTLFLPFALIGHIMFGNDIEEFNSVYNSISFSFLCLMGEYSRYVDETTGEEITAVMPSGVPIFVLTLWYVIFMSLIVLVLLNMLLAIIIEHYMTAERSMMELPELPSIWHQFSDYMKFLRETKKFVPLEVLDMQLNNDAAMAHPHFHVNVGTLLQGFEKFGMTEENAAWLFHVLQDELRKRREKLMALMQDSGLTINLDAHVDEVNDHLVELDEHIEENKQETHELKETLQNLLTSEGPALSRLSAHNMMSKKKPKKRNNKNAKALGGALGDLLSSQGGVAKTLNGMEQTMAKIQRDQARLGKRLDELSAAQGVTRVPSSRGKKDAGNVVHHTSSKPPKKGVP